MVKFSEIADFYFDADDIEVAAVLARVQVSIFVIDVNEVHINKLVYAILIFPLGRLELFFDFSTIVSSLSRVSRLLFFVLAAICFLREDAFHDIVMKKVEEVYLLLWLQLDSFYLNKFLLIFLDANKNDSSSRVEKAHNSLGQMHLYRLVF